MGQSEMVLQDGTPQRSMSECGNEYTRRFVMHTKKFWLLIILVVVASMAVAGCAAPATQPAPAAEEEAAHRAFVDDLGAPAIWDSYGSRE